MIKVSIDPHSGFCIGVVAAIKKVENYLEENPSKKLFCIGSIVHNTKEVRRLENKGMITINHEQISTIEVSTVFIRAHGEPPHTYDKIIKAAHKLIDATCPVVLSLQQKIKKTYLENPKKQIIIFGKHGHAEVIGLQGQTENHAIVISNINEIEKKVDKNKDILLFSQTTMPLARFINIENSIRQYTNKKVKSFNTICRQVISREKELKYFAQSKNVIIFISDKDSSNGQLLFKICQENNKNSYFISSPEEIKKQWFSIDTSVGICGATSTPLWLMEKTATFIQQIGETKIDGNE